MKGQSFYMVTGTFPIGHFPRDFSPLCIFPVSFSLLGLFHYYSFSAGIFPDIFLKQGNQLMVHFRRLVLVWFGFFRLKLALFG